MVDHDLTAKEWGRKQAAQAPEWTPEMWKRIGQILGVVFTGATASTPTQGDPDQTLGLAFWRGER